MSAKNIIKEAKRQLGDISQPKFAETTGFDLDRLKNLESGRVKKFTDEEINILVQFTTLSDQEIRISQMAGDNWDKYDKESLIERVALGAQNIDSSRFVKVPLKSAYVHAGKGVVNHEVETKGTVMIDKMLFKILPNLNNISAVEVIGKSMYPTLDEGDYVVIEHNTNFNGEGIYVLSFDDLLLVKRLQASSHGIKILSDNKFYDDDIYDSNNDQRALHIIGKVILRIQR